MGKTDDIVQKEIYAKCLLVKLSSMIEENQKARTSYFSERGRIHSKAAISRARIELNKVLIEIERGI